MNTKRESAMYTFCLTYLKGWVIGVRKVTAKPLSFRYFTTVPQDLHAARSYSEFCFLADIILRIFSVSYHQNPTLGLPVKVVLGSDLPRELTNGRGYGLWDRNPTKYKNIAIETGKTHLAHSVFMFKAEFTIVIIERSHLPLRTLKKYRTIMGTIFFP